MNRTRRYSAAGVAAMLLIAAAASAGEESSMKNGAMQLTYDFNKADQFADWKVGPTDKDKDGTYDYGNHPVSWTWQQEHGRVRGNGGYLLLPQRLSGHQPIVVDFIVGKDNGNVHCGLFSGEPSFTAKSGGFYFNAGGCSKSFTSMAQDGDWFAEKQLPFQKGFYPIRVSYVPNVQAETVDLQYSVNGETYFEVTRPLPKNVDDGLRFAFLSGWVGGGYSVDSVSISGTPAAATQTAQAGK